MKKEHVIIRHKAVLWNKSVSDLVMHCILLKYGMRIAMEANMSESY